MKNKKQIIMIIVWIFIFITLTVIYSFFQKYDIKPPFLLTRMSEYEKVNIKYVKLNELQNVTNSIDPHLEFSYMRCNDRQEFSSSNDTLVNLTIDIDKQTLFEKVLASNKIEPIEIPASLAGYKMVYVKGDSNYHIWAYFVKDNKVKIMLLDSISNNGRFKEIGSIVAFDKIYKTFATNVNKNKINDRIAHIKKDKSNKIVFYSKKTMPIDIVFYTNKSKNNGIIIERGE